VKSNLLRSYEAAQQSEHSKSFEVAGVAVELPRLSLGRQAKLEKMVRAAQKERGERMDFSLSTLRNTAAVRWAEAVDEAHKKTITEAIERGIDMDIPFKDMDERDVEFIKTRRQSNIYLTWGSYAKELFPDFDRELMMDAIAMSLRQAHGGEQVIDPDNGKPALDSAGNKILLNRDFVDRWLAGDNGNLLDAMFLSVTGLVNMRDGEISGEEPETAKEFFAEEAGGDTGESATELEANSTSESTPEL